MVKNNIFYKGGNKSWSQNLKCQRSRLVFLIREAKVVGQSANALEQFAMKRTCGSHLPL